MDCVSEDCEIHYEDKQNYKQVEQEAEERVAQYVCDQTAIHEERPRAPFPPPQQESQVRDLTMETTEKSVGQGANNAPSSQETEEVEKGDDSIEGSTPEGSEYDSSDDEFEGGDNYLDLITDNKKPYIKILRIVARYYEQTFLEENGKTYLQPFFFDNMIKTIRLNFWHHRLLPINYDAKTFVQEWPPVGGIFAPRGYIAPDGTFFNRNMKEATTRLKNMYGEVHKLQTTAAYCMSEEEFVNDRTRADYTINFINQTLAEKNQVQPTNWGSDYLLALGIHGYPPNSVRDQTRTSAPEPPKN
ncbi:hypothetical protein KC353_g2171 [Hortaea werneckii]|nr:hypothetical protein KC353_g2171 [Hortaea werneckii]